MIHSKSPIVVDGYSLKFFNVKTRNFDVQYSLKCNTELKSILSFMLQQNLGVFNKNVHIYS